MMKNTDKIVSCLKELGIDCSKEGKLGVFRKEVPSPIHEILCVVIPNRKGVTIHGHCDVFADSNDPEAILRAAEFFTRVNYGLSCGCFELDMEDGEINYRVFIDCSSKELTPAAMEKAIESIERAYMMWGRGIMKVVYTNTSAMEAKVHTEEAMLRDAIKMLEEMLEGENDETLRSIILEMMEKSRSYLALDDNGK